jgi:hypothetical protein
VKCKSSRKSLRKFRGNFIGILSSHRNTVQNFVTKVIIIGVLIHRNPRCQHQVLTEGKMENTGAWLEHSSHKPFKQLAQDMDI